MERIVIIKLFELSKHFMFKGYERLHACLETEMSVSPAEQNEQLLTFGRNLLSHLM